MVLATRPCAEGVEVLAMPPDAMPSHEHAAAPRAAPAPARRALPSPAALAESSPAKDAEQLSMSTLSFQDYVRERMLRRRKAELQAQNEAASPPPMPAQTQGPAAFTPPLCAAATIPAHPLRCPRGAAPMQQQLGRGGVSRSDRLSAAGEPPPH